MMRHCGAARRGLLLAASLIVSSLSGAVADEAPRPVVVELFTSQGCSSCPPADAYLRELARRSDVIPLAYHVDYWNYIGWVDPFASQQTTQRQRDYARALGQRYVYTPEMVIGGARHEDGAKREAVEKLIAAAQRDAAPGPAIALRRVGDDNLQISIAAQGAAPGEALAVWLVKFDREHWTKVAQGENQGRMLGDFQVVRSLRQVGSWQGEKFEIELASEAAGDGGCAVLLQRGGTGPILAASMLRFGPGG
ncbi:MAG: hypothetical protein JWL84_3109 [Rhodospirillales bacterium]|jgi:hypothetical protein|nr:hypothetical protein [Rhodospirillales bacterium]